MARSVVITDDFQSYTAGNALGAPNWTQTNTNWGSVKVEDASGDNVVNGSGTALSIDNAAIAVYTGAALANDQYAKITIQSTSFQSTQYRTGVVVRASSDTNASRDCYFFQIGHDAASGNPHTAILGKVVDGTATELHSGSLSITNGDTISVEVEGTTLRAFLNDTEIGGDFTQTDADLSSGFSGVWAAGDRIDTIGDDFEAGDITTGSVPTITDVNTDEILQSGETGATFTGTNLGATTADRTIDLVQGAVEIEQTQLTGDGTGGTFDVVLENGADLKFGSASFVLTRTADGESGSLPVTLEPPTGQLYVDVGTPDTTASNRITAVPDIETGDQIQARGEGGGAVPTGLTINADATFEFSSGNTPEDFDVRIWDVTDATWGAWATQTTASIEAALSGTASLSLTATGDLETGAVESLSGAASMELSSSGDLTGLAELSAVQLITLTASGELVGDASLSGSVLLELIASGDLVTGNIADLSGVAGIMLVPSARLTGVAGLGGTASLMLDASADLFISGDLPTQLGIEVLAEDATVEPADEQSSFSVGAEERSFTVLPAP